MFKDRVQQILKKFNTLMESNLPPKGVISPNGKIFTEAPLYQLDGDVLANQGYIKYNLIRPRFIDLPSADITDIQKLVVQNIIYHRGNDKIAIYSQDNVTAQYFASAKNKIDDILKALKKDDITEAILREGDKKIFDKDSGYNISEDEEYYYELLKKKWPDVERSVTDDRFVNPNTKRHFQIDFLIPSENMIVQINKHIKHGRAAYDPSNPIHQQDVKWLQNQDGDFYKKILHTWTELDPLKRELAKQAGFKYVEIFNLDEFEKWYANPELTYEEYKTAPESMQYDSDEYFKQKARGRDVYGNDSQPYAP